MLVGSKKKVLIVIDVQNDFVTGSLGTPEAQAITPNVKEKFNKYKNLNKICFLLR
ncbi:isochorismatase family protein [Ruminococcus sp. AM46-18]|nr:isochorismatase family protein [Ruminococcus sp. AM46-18]